ncbi:MAG: protein translocase subunit SecD, partial [Nitrospinaceae bacterium]|nr:protein translocase subunit SecD [Nitrospinaceae bacterium]
IVLRAGALPAPVVILENRTVGPSLGKDSIEKGITSIIYGGLLVVVFIVLYYKWSGAIAVTALFLNIVLLAGALAYFGAALTLPGIAGIILTVGMAIDANVLVFERIREEVRIGKTVRAAIDAGFSKAFRTIVDANITTFIAAVVLFQFGTGPIKGFAITLCIGIAASMFTAVFVSRAIFDSTMSQKKLDKLSI